MEKHLLLISGLVSGADLWSHQKAHLQQLVRIHIPSVRESRADLAVQAILDETPPRFSLAGHSMGGWLCLELMRRAPDRVEKLCLLNVSAREDSREKADRRREMIARAKEGRYSDVAKEVADLFVFRKEVKERVEQMFLQAGSELFQCHEEMMLARGECFSVLPSIRCPTLVIHGAQDQNFHLDEHEELRQGIANAKLAVVEECGHMSPMEAPQAITALLRLWLEWF